MADSQLSLASLSLQSPLRERHKDINSKSAEKVRLSSRPQKIPLTSNTQAPKRIEKENSKAAPVTPLKQDVRLRKGATNASPRTPHINLINTKRQKQQSQLARLSLSVPAVSMAADAPSIDKNDPFMVPEVKQRPKYLDPVGSLQKQIVILRTQLDEELRCKTMLQRKLEYEQAERVRVEMELKVLKAELEKQRRVVKI